jgi:hypothetical protein
VNETTLRRWADEGRGRTFFRRSLDATAEHLADVADIVLFAITRSYEGRRHAAGRWGAEC